MVSSISEIKIGMVFGRLTILSAVARKKEQRPNGSWKYTYPVDVRCDCGKVKTVSAERLLVKGKPLHSCGDHPHHEKSDVEFKGQYRQVTEPDHPLADKDGRLLIHRKVLYDSIGPGPHPCHWCGKLVTFQKGKRTAEGALSVDHVDGNKLNNDLANLVPACHRCNCGRAIKCADDELFIVRKNGYRVRAVKRVCQRCGKDFLFIPAVGAKRPNRGKYCSRHCIHRRSG